MCLTWCLEFESRLPADPTSVFITSAIGFLTFYHWTIMPSLQLSTFASLASIGLAWFGVPQLASELIQTPLKTTSNTISTCPITSLPSCSNTTVVSNLCCYEYPGGLLLQTQFWDTNPSTGPSESWTIHGLWPEHCDLTFSENCDPSRAYKNVFSLLSEQGADETLEFMQEFWKDVNHQDEKFWEVRNFSTKYLRPSQSRSMNGKPTAPA
ncbi:ribonuclease T2-like protein [Mycena rebaudengoi]|nr:ribonuclease T2-like protein [Mycena rebaudengoi]